MNHWHHQLFSFKFQLSDWTLFTVKLPLLVQTVPLGTGVDATGIFLQSGINLHKECEGFALRAAPISNGLKKVHVVDSFLCYVPLQYQHSYIDMSMTFAEYESLFSSKTRSTIKRKIRKFADKTGGELVWKIYRSPDEITSFHKLAREVSAKTYQEKLLDAGIPGDSHFIEKMKALAENNSVRGFVLFDRDRPVSYLYCPVADGTLIYAYLGYDPEYMKFSVGTILQWIAMESLFNENRYRFFDFTEGQSAHKELFSTHNRPSANIYYLRNSLKNKLIVYGHILFNNLNEGIGHVLDKLGLKAKIKRVIRMGRP